MRDLLVSWTTWVVSSRMRACTDSTFSSSCWRNCRIASASLLCSSSSLSTCARVWRTSSTSCSTCELYSRTYRRFARSFWISAARSSVMTIVCSWARTKSSVMVFPFTTASELAHSSDHCAKGDHTLMHLFVRLHLVCIESLHETRHLRETASQRQQSGPCHLVVVAQAIDYFFALSGFI